MFVSRRSIEVSTIIEDFVEVLIYNMNEGPLDRPLHVQTPLLKSRKLSEVAGCSVWLKLDNVQNSGSFKVRGLGYHCQKVFL